MNATPVNSATPAVISGRPAAVSDPNVMSRMISAAMTPTSVAGPTLNPSAASIAWPPAATLSPGTSTDLMADKTGLPVFIPIWLAGSL